MVKGSAWSGQIDAAAARSLTACPRCGDSRLIKSQSKGLPASFLISCINAGCWGQRYDGHLNAKLQGERTNKRLEADRQKLAEAFERAEE